MPFCPGCGLDTSEPGRAPSAAEEAGERATGDVVRRRGDDDRAGPRVEPGLAASPNVVAAAIVAIGLVVFGLLIRSPAGSGPGGEPQGGPGSTASSAPGATSSGRPPLITDLSFVSPADGETVATEHVTVIGLAPPGLTVTRDVSFGIDQHATADGTGHWAIDVDLDEGDNDLVFRLGDDRSTEKRLRVTFTPQTP